MEKPLALMQKLSSEIFKLRRHLPVKFAHCWFNADLFQMLFWSRLAAPALFSSRLPEHFLARNYMAGTSTLNMWNRRGRSWIEQAQADAQRLRRRIFSNMTGKRNSRVFRANCLFLAIF